MNPPTKTAHVSAHVTRMANAGPVRVTTNAADEILAVHVTAVAPGCRPPVQTDTPDHGSR